MNCESALEQDKKAARDRYQVLMKRPGAKRDATLKLMASGKEGLKDKLDEDMTWEPNADGKLERGPKWPCLRTLRDWT